MARRSDIAGRAAARSSRWAAELSLRGRIAELEAQLESCRTQAMQIESLRRLGTWQVDLDTGALSWSEGTYHIFGLAPDEPVTVERALSFYPEEAREAIAKGLDEAVATGAAYDLTVPFRSPGSEAGWVRTLGRLQMSGGTRRLVGVIEDVTAEKIAQDRLHDLAFRDALTGLLNRRAFEARLGALEGSGRRAALFVIDLDNFKTVNDTRGHPAGDHLLQEIARRLQHTVRAGDTVARLGGDEFGIVLLDLDPALLEQRAQTFLHAIRAPVEIEGAAAIHPTASIGACHSALAAGPDRLFQGADLALYRAKSLGRNQGQVFHTALRAETDRRSQLLGEMRDAIEQKQLTVLYQPIVDLRTSLVRGMEALVRWNHPLRGLLAPDAFAVAFEDASLAVAIDDFVLEQALSQMRAWVEDGVPVAAVNVNASDMQLRRPDLAARIETLLGRHGLSPDRLKLEVAETAFLGRDVRQVAATIGVLSQLGVVCALDDFGTGYASLTHLRQFPVERIKVDRSFVANMSSDPFERGLVKTLIELGHNLGIRVTAEGVETAEQLALLRALGCDCAQGYLIGRPSPAAEVPGMVARWYARQAPAKAERQTAEALTA